MNNYLRSQTAITLRELGKAPKEVVAFLQNRELPESVQELVDAGNFHADETRAAWGKAEEILDCCETHKITVVAAGDPLYPKRLGELQKKDSKYTLSGFCPILYCKGSPNGLNTTSAAAVIGTRDPTQHGRKMARLIGKALAQVEITVVSGLALGCDTEGHLGCLEAGGTGIAVLAHGLDRIYPKANIELAERLIESGGCLVSEYYPGVPPDRRKFACRDRIQSGLSDAVLVVETPEKDGTMHTVNFAERQGRARACVACSSPLMDSYRTAGNDLLLKAGAYKLTNPEQAVQFVMNSYQSVKSSIIQEGLL